MNKIVYILLTIVTLSSLNANANVTVLGGNVTCGKWVENRKQNNAEYMQIYLLGFISGLSMGEGKNFLENMDGEAIYVWTDNYCKANPTDGLIRAAIMFKNEMIKKNSL